MSRYALQRLIRSLITIFVSITLTFFIVRMMPSNPVDILIDPHMTEEVKAALMESYGLDQPKGVQYLVFLKGVFTGDLGISFSTRRPVTELLAQRLPWTLLLIGICTLLITIIGIPLGILAARKKGKTVDRVITTTVTLFISVFIPFLAFLLLYFFAFKLNWLPTGGAYTPPPGTGWSFVRDVARHAILPGVTLAIASLASVVLYTRNSMTEALRDDYVRTALSKGASLQHTVRHHALRNAMIPTVTVIGLNIGTMVGGAVLTETVYSWPGIGRMMYDAIQALDYPVLQGGFLLLSISVVIMNFITDIIVAWLDPRIKLGADA
ncbi:MAG: ABC transporter permease [Fastidiosipila sp.]|nr:ABC transporter permease [Fastidiosipila sp.]